MNDNNGASKSRVLIVDDEPRILRFVGLSLESHGFEVCVASSGEEALSIAESDRPDVMVLDIFMPGMDGFGVLQRLREREHSRGLPVVPVIIFSARASVAEQAMGLGANDFISKPFLPEDLAEKVRAVLSKSKG